MQIVFLAPDMPQGPAAKHIELLADRHSVTLGSPMIALPARRRLARHA